MVVLAWLVLIRWGWEIGRRAGFRMGLDITSGESFWLLCAGLYRLVSFR